MAGLTVAEHELIGMKKRLIKEQLARNLTKREQVAASVLQGLFANSSLTSQPNELLVNRAFECADMFLAHSKNEQ